MPKNVILKERQCWKCGDEIDFEIWTMNPTLGAKCRNCNYGIETPFTPENIDLAFKVEMTRNRFTKIWRSEPTFAGTKVLINGRNATLVSTNAGHGFVIFSDEFLTTGISGLSFWDLVRIHEQSGKMDVSLHFTSPTMATTYLESIT